MTERTIHSLSAFSFSPEFNSAENERRKEAEFGEMVSIPREELARLLDTAKRDAAEQFREEHSKAFDHLETLANRLQNALTQLLELADRLDRTEMGSQEKVRLKGLMTSACQSIVEGQGDLFAEFSSSTDR